MTGYQSYQGNQIEGAGPLGLILLTYDALYKSLGRAKLSIENSDYYSEAEHTGRALEAVIELTTSLNMDAGGEVARNLANLYSYMTTRLTENMCQQSTDGIDEVMQLVATLREGWESLNQNQQKKSVSQPSQPRSHSQLQTASLAYAA
ncbi:flagellar protein FliS [Mariprofundus micogutta]|uniref:Flagellar secretion chaperone FliS n=1 Tax=Mariprofundus micogutta TaxID=1921010 RepID=A0A1L8CJJ8_9PROT|nr:flagellar export chaperone FliS [Mariprofundus micogutta]GAV19094.1 flagellar protein FliS [Mariprofundus micogutta]